ncbi:hypothetical protein AGR9A_Lc40628 [Agrobacterium salinitolerans str. Hayward 0363]|nr:hypothetical protein AGR9A_Lc40628 [Agrobacterium salinitolerans str. Hayward 0363]
MRTLHQLVSLMIEVAVPMATN